MAEGLNAWRGIGNLGADPEMRFTSGGKAVMNLRLACSENRKKGEQWEEHTEWISVVVWDKRAEGLAKILEKGSRVYIEGPLRTTSYEDKEGIKRYKTEVTAEKVVLCGGKRSGSTSSDASEPTSSDNIPF